MKDLTTGSVSRHLLNTTAMMLVGMVLQTLYAVSYTHLRAHETVLALVCRLLLEKKT